MLPLGVTPDNNKITVTNPNVDFPMTGKTEAEIFSEDKDGNIVIMYWRINGDLITYPVVGSGKMSEINAKTKTYITKRLKEPKGDMKYQMPAGQGTKPWFSPETTAAYGRKDKIETIYLTEGVFKAWAASKEGAHVVGLSSVTTYRDAEGGLHTDIQRLIIDCRVENVVVLWDADCIDISTTALKMRDDLTKRPYGFFAAVKNIQKLVGKIKIPKEQPTPTVHFMHVKSDCLSSKPKGLDDLIIAAKRVGKDATVIRHMLDLNGDSPYFYKFNIKASGLPLLLEHFALNNIQSFYNRHLSIIKESEFFYKGDLYRWDDTKDELALMAPGWAKELRWIGDEFFVERLVPGATRDRRVLLKRDQATLVKQYGKDFYTYLEYYDGFCNVPSHFDYQRIIEKEGKNFYNRYFPFKHEPEKGDCDNIIRFFKHIFGEEKVKHPVTGSEYLSWEMGLDYVQILLNEPNMILPIVCLFSLENSTGKSTFGKLLGHIFGDNVVQIGNADLQSDFNEVYSDKLLAVCEETLLERKKDAERVKALSTSDQITVNPKGQRQFAIDFFCKFMFFSNNRRMIYLTKHDERYWIIQVRKAKGEDVNLLRKMKAEVPAFIDYLQDRKLHTERESRMHFHPGLVKTDAFYDTVKVNEPQAATDLREGIAELFLESKDLQVIEMPNGKIKEEFFSPTASTKWVHEILKDYLNVDLKRDKNGVAKTQRGEYFRYIYDEHAQKFVKDVRKWKGRPYIFKRADFVDDSESASFVSDEEAETQATEPDTITAEQHGKLPF